VEKIMISAEIVPLLRELFSCLPETRYREPHELQTLLWSLGCTDNLAPEAEIAAALEVARGDFDPEGSAA
jgi:hypothetical protein